MTRRQKRARTAAVRILAAVGIFLAVAGCGTDDLGTLWVPAVGVGLLVLGICLGAGRWDE